MCLQPILTETLKKKNFAKKLKKQNFHKGSVFDSDSKYLKFLKFNFTSQKLPERKKIASFSKME